jgi:SAM-dependent methyltransferase
MRKIQETILFASGLLRFDALQLATHDYHNVFLKSLRDVRELIQCPLDEATIMVLGCGYNYPDVILFSNCSKRTVGLDVTNAFYRDGMIRTFKDIRCREGGIAKALSKTLLLRLTYYRYYPHLQRISGQSIDHQKYELVSYDGSQMPFEDETFDVVLSNAVLQQVDDVEAVFQEAYRVTKKKGISYHLWHNYYSFSGGRAPETLCLRYPWGHLRGKYKARGLNRITPTEVHDSFSEYFEIIGLYQMDKNHLRKGRDIGFQYEREDLLSANIRNELAAFPIELLLTRAYLIVGRKKASVNTHLANGPRKEVHCQQTDSSEREVPD